MKQSAGLPDVPERQKSNASNAGLERGYLDRSAVSLTTKGVRRTFRVDRKPKDLSFFTEGEKDGRIKQAWTSHAQTEFLLPKENGQSTQSASSGMRGNATTPIASCMYLNYLRALQACDRLFPGFKLENHGVEYIDGMYFVYCLKI